MNLQHKLEEIYTKVKQNIYLNEEVFLWNIIQKNPDINLLEYRICYAPSCIEKDGETYYGRSWWLEKIE